MNKLLFALLLVFISGCTVTEKYIYYNYSQGQEMVVNVGEEMTHITDVTKNGEVIENFERTLTYSGKQSTVIKIFYREFWNNLARQAFTQDLSYDLKDGKIISFKSTKIKVIQATNNDIRFVVLESPVFMFKSGDKITDTQIIDAMGEPPPLPENTPVDKIKKK